MHDSIVQAHIVHRIPRRLRIAVPGRRHDDGYFEILKRTLAGCEGVLAVDVNPLTASVLIRHDSSFGLHLLRPLGIRLAVNDAKRRLGPVDAAGPNHDAVFALAKFARIAIGGRMGAFLLEQIVEWCARALIEAMLRPTTMPAQGRQPATRQAQVLPFPAAT